MLTLQFRSSVSSAGDDLPPQAGDLETLGLAPKGYQLLDSGLPAKDLETILSSGVHQVVICPEMETIFIMVRAAPPETSQLPYWFSAGVPSELPVNGFDPCCAKGL